jgi:hypothetical protein
MQKKGNNMKNFIQISLLILVSFMVFSCFRIFGNKFDYDVTVSFPGHYNNVTTIKENIPIYAVTDSIFSYFNNVIDYNMSTDSNKISIEFTRIYMPGYMAQPAEGPAVSIIDLLLDGQYDTYELNIKSGKSENIASITYIDSMYVLTAVAEENITFIKDTLDLK